MPTDIVADTDLDAALAEFQGQLNMIFTRARSMWKESAARIHPDLQPAGYKLLSYIARSGTASAHHLAECFEMDKSVVSRQTRMLEEAGLIVSRADESDGRDRKNSLERHAATPVVWWTSRCTPPSADRISRIGSFCNVGAE